MTRGDRLGSYEIIERIGAGGMGEVYTARDTKLGRLVAIKVLPSEKIYDPDRKARFLQEARAASALNHPNIVTIHGIVEEQGSDCIVMEYVAGKTLEHTIPRKGMRVPEMLHYAVQIAAALEAAHGGGIVHRDLKPGNIMVTESGGHPGTVKVLDFGLAKLAAEAALPPGGATLTMDMAAQAKTLDGMVVGTAAYMSPEQAEGKPVDARSDIFSFGAVLYEMLTGERAFRGDSTLSTLSAVLRDEPRPLRELAPGTPAEIERIVNRCLRKDAGRRFQHTADLKIALEDLKQASDSGVLAAQIAPEPPTRPARRRLVWTVVAVSLIVAAACAAWWLRRTRPGSGDETLVTVPLTGYPGVQSHPSFSPDGNQVAFAWQKEGEKGSHIYIKLIGPGSPLLLTRGDANDNWPRWSPDGSSIAFLRRVPRKMSIVLIPALGGPERVVKDWNGNLSNLCWSPDGQWLVFGRGAGDTTASLRGICAISLSTGAERTLTAPRTNFGDVGTALSPDGRTLAFVRSSSGNGDLYLQALGEDLQPRGDPRLLLSQDQEITAPAWTPDGRDIVYALGRMTNTGLWRIDVSGGVPRRLPGIDRGAFPAFSKPRGPRRLARMAYMHYSADDNIWRLPMAGGRPGEPARLIASTRRESEPHYSPDGKRIAYSSDISGNVEVWVANADGSNAVQLTSLHALTTSAPRWSPDGRRIVFISTLPGQSEIYMVDAAGGAPVRLTNNPAHDTAPSWSRDGKWVYFASNRSGSFQVWKMAPDPAGTPVQVTRHGGYAAIESWDGKTLYYAMRNRVDGIWKVPAEGGEETRVLPDIFGWGNFDVTPEGIVFMPIATPAVLQFHDFRTARVQTLLQLPRPADFGLSASPADGSIIYTQVDQESGELVLVDEFR